MAYAVKEIFYTLQGEGAHAGTPAVFCRFSGCNLWSGREEDRAKAACTFCDTDFVGTDGTAGGKYTSASDLADAILYASLPLAGGTEGGLVNTCASVDQPTPNPSRKREGDTIALSSSTHLNNHHRFVVLTGGEPLLQLDTPLIEALHERGFTIAVETNGTLDAPPGIDWICVSPKAANPLRLTHGHELKLVYPQPGIDPKNFEHLDFGRFSLQPMDGPERDRNTQDAIAYCLQNPLWHLSLQTHKMVGIR